MCIFLLNRLLVLHPRSSFCWLHLTQKNVRKVKNGRCDTILIIIYISVFFFLCDIRTIEIIDCQVLIINCQFVDRRLLFVCLTFVVSVFSTKVRKYFGFIIVSVPFSSYYILLLSFPSYHQFFLILLRAWYISPSFPSFCVPSFLPSAINLFQFF